MSELKIKREMLKTSLYPVHQSMNARFVSFAGYSMPLHFPTGIKAEHIHTREHASLFDVSHMGQIRITGNDVEHAIENLLPGDIQSLPLNSLRYSVLTNQEGGIIDDLMVCKYTDYLLLIVNAANKRTVSAYIERKLGSPYIVELLKGQSLLALQGPKAAQVLQNFNSDISRLKFLQSGNFLIDDLLCRVSRCGYTGEDGFELSLADEDVKQLSERLLESKDVRPAGIGARDSLRLEAGLCLYGNDIFETTTPIEADLGWVIASKYIKTPSTASFPGAKILMEQLKAGADKRRVGLLTEGKRPVRGGEILLSTEGTKVGWVSSGGFSITLNEPVAMAYLDAAYSTPGTELIVEIKGRSHTMRVAELPFVKHQYHKGK